MQSESTEHIEFNVCFTQLTLQWKAPWYTCFVCMTRFTGSYVSVFPWFWVLHKKTASPRTRKAIGHGLKEERQKNQLLVVNISWFTIFTAYDWRHPRYCPRSPDFWKHPWSSTIFRWFFRMVAEEGSNRYDIRRCVCMYVYLYTYIYNIYICIYMWFVFCHCNFIRTWD